VNRVRAISWAAPTGAAVLVGAAVLAGVDAATGGPPAAWIDLGVAAAGALLWLLGATGGGRTWALVAAGAAVAYLVLSAAPASVSREALPVARLAVAVAALVVYVVGTRPLASRVHYALACAVLGVSAAYFLLWEPPPPKPVPIARPLAQLKDDLLARMPGWRGEHQRLPESIEKILGADEYLNLRLTSAEVPYDVQVFITYNANAMTKIPHVPWVCMTQAGFRLVDRRRDEFPNPARPGREIRPNVLLFEPGEEMPPVGALMFQYFNVGGQYEANRQVARILATSGAVGRRGSFLSQTQVSVYVPMDEAATAMDRSSRPYTLGRQVLEAVVRLLEERYYPDLDGSEGG